MLCNQIHNATYVLAGRRLALEPGPAPVHADPRNRPGEKYVNQ